MMPSRQCLALIAGVILLSACQGSEEQPQPTQESPPAERPALPAVEPPLGREELLLAVVRAASDFATGRDDQAEQRALDGKRFSVRLRFGCPIDGATRAWTFDEESRVLRIQVEPEISGESPAISALAAPEVESVEGFWMRRPWMLQPACPRPRAPATPVSEEDEEEQSSEASESETQAPAGPAEPEPRVGIAQFFTAEDSRVDRRNDRAYEATVQLQEGERPSSNGYDLVLSGRLQRLADGRVIACSPGTGAQPSCVVSVSFDHVAVSGPEGATIAEWSRS